MFQTASTFCGPVRPPKFTWWVTVAPGWAPLSSNSAIFCPPHEVLPRAGGVTGRQVPLELGGAAHRSDLPALGVVVELGEAGVAAAAAGQPLRALDALRLVRDVAAADRPGGTLCLPAGRVGDVAVCARGGRGQAHGDHRGERRADEQGRLLPCVHVLSFTGSRSAEEVRGCGDPCTAGRLLMGGGPGMRRAWTRPYRRAWTRQEWCVRRKLRGRSACGWR